MRGRVRYLADLRRTELRILASATSVLLALSLFHAEAAATAPRTVRVVMTEFAFRPSVVRLPAGVAVTLEFVNRGQIAHQVDAPVLRNAPVTVWDAGLYVEAPGVEIVRLQPGRRARLLFVPRGRGRFRFTCSIEGHTEAGMAGVLDVR